jgi:OPA family glycerol-3-phosphate transporter-like MFS transporter
MGRYNLKAAHYKFDEAHMSNSDFGTIFGVGAIVYGLSFIINGPLADKLGGKKTMMIGAVGSAIVNLLLGFVVYNSLTADVPTPIFVPFVILYAVNMYFQSFGAVSIVKVNAAWFHLEERGVFGGIFGTLISLGIFLAFDLTGMLLDVTKDVTKTVVDGKDVLTNNYQIWWAFFIPAGILIFMAILDFFIVKDTPSQAGFEDFNTGDAGADDTEDATSESVIQLYKKILFHPVIILMIIIEFSSGVLRNGVMQWGKDFAKALHHTDVSHIYKTDFFFQNWGLILMIAGISGGFFAGFISDKFFKSRRGPSAFFLYVGLFIGFVLMFIAIKFKVYGLLGFISFFVSMCVIGVHGMLSGTASMDFGGKKSAATVAGVIDGFVYLGTGFQGIVLGHLLDGAEHDLTLWIRLPIFLLPFTLLGIFFTWKIWNARPDTKGRGGH